MFLVHLASFLPCWESKLVFEWPKRITQVKFIVLFSSRRHGGRTRRLCATNLHGCAVCLQNRTRRHDAPHAAEQTAALICRSSVGGKFDRYLLRPQAALGSGFSLQAAFWYQNAMLALFLCSKKSQSVVRFSFRLEEFFAFHFAQAMKFKIFALRMP